MGGSPMQASISCMGFKKRVPACVHKRLSKALVWPYGDLKTSLLLSQLCSKKQVCHPPH